MVIAFEIFSLGDTEPELHLEGHLPLNCNVRFKKYYCNIRVIAGTQPNNFRGMQGWVELVGRAIVEESFALSATFIHDAFLLILSKISLESMHYFRLLCPGH